MSVLVVEGLILDARQLENGMTAFDLSENIGTKEQPEYNTFNCIGKFSEGQTKYIHKGRIVQVTSDLKVKRTEKEGKYYTNLNCYVYNLVFKGEIKEKEG